MNVSNILVPLAVSLVMVFLWAASKKKAREDKNGNKILRLPVLYPVIGGIVTLGGLLILVYGLLTCKPEEIVIVVISSLLLVGLGTILLLMGLIFKIVITQDQLEQTTMFGKTKTIKWADINSVAFGKVSLELKIKSKDQKINAHMHLVGFRELVNQIESKTKFKAIQVPNI